MCDLRNDVKINAKTKTVYKICTERDGKYYATLSGLRIAVGKVKDLGFVKERETGEVKSSFWSDDKYVSVIPRWRIRLYTTECELYNPLAVGRTTGFATKKMALRAQESFCTPNLVLLKLKITGDLVSGTGKKISSDERLDRAKVYAGKEILSVEKV